MGCVAGKYADFTVITSDNPRYEEPERIMQTIEEGMKETKGQYQMMVDRKKPCGLCWHRDSREIF